MVVETDFVRMQQVDKGLSRRRNCEEAVAKEDQKKRRLETVAAASCATTAGGSPTPVSAPAQEGGKVANPWGPIFQNAEHFREMHIC